MAAAVKRRRDKSFILFEQLYGGNSIGMCLLDPQMPCDQILRESILLLPANIRNQETTGFLFLRDPIFLQI